MKLPVVLLAVSLAANAVLFATLSLRSPASPANSTPADPAAAAKAAIQAAGTRRAAQEAEAKALAQLWVPEKPENFGALVDRLRAAGFPAATIRAILQAQLEEQFAARRRALFASTEDQPLWKAGAYNYDPKLSAALSALYREQRDIMKSLLGADSQDQTGEARTYEKRQFGDLAQDKIDRIRRIQEEYSELQQEIYASMRNGPLLPEDREELASIEKARRAEIAKALTPEELFEYDLRSSSTASQLRSRLAAFKPTEEEFRSIFKIQQAMDEQLGGANVYTSADFQARQAKQTEVNKQIEGVLTPQRAADYNIVAAPNTQQLSRIAARFDLPLSAVGEVAALQRETQQRISQVMQNTELGAEARTQQLTALQRETATKVEQKLGTRGLAAYRENGGQWLDNMVRIGRPPTPRQ